MARTRSIHPGQAIDEDVATMSLAARYVWAFLPCHADREGRMKDSPFTLKAAILPGDADVDMEAILVELASKGHVIRYQVAGKRYLQIRTFLKWQTPHTRETASMIPPLSAEVVHEHDLGSASTSPGPAGVSPGPSIPDPDPGPDQISSGSGSPRAPARSTSSATLWSGRDWRNRFGREWAVRYRQNAYGDAADTTACMKLDDLFETTFSAADRIDAQARAQEMFAEFLASTEPRVVQRGHVFLFFVHEWGTLRVDPTLRPRRRTRTEETIETLRDLDLEAKTA